MPETDRRPAPTLWMFLLVLLGLYTIPRSASNAPASSKPESKRPDSGQAPESSCEVALFDFPRSDRRAVFLGM